MGQITSASPSMQLTRLRYFTSYPGILLISILKPIQNKDGESGLSLPTFLLNNRTAPLSVGESSLPVFPRKAVLPGGSSQRELRDAAGSMSWKPMQIATLSLIPFMLSFSIKRGSVTKGCLCHWIITVLVPSLRFFSTCKCIGHNRSTAHRNAEQHEPHHPDVYTQWSCQVETWKLDNNLTVLTILSTVFFQKTIIVSNPFEL